MTRALRILLAAALAALAPACGSGDNPTASASIPSSPQATTSPTDPEPGATPGPFRYRDDAGGYSFLVPASWFFVGSQALPEGRFSDFSSEPVHAPLAMSAKAAWLTIKVLTTSSDCANEGEEHLDIEASQSITVAGEDGVKTYAGPTSDPQFAGAGGLFILVNVERGDRCYHFRFITNTKAQRTAHEPELIAILESVRFEG